MTTKNLYFMNQSGIPLHVVSNSLPGTGLTADETFIPATTTAPVLIGQADFSTTTDPWGWFTIGRNSTDGAFQVFADNTGGGTGGAPQATFGNYAPDSTRTAPNPVPLPVAVASASFSDPDFLFTFNGQQVVMHLRLVPGTSSAPTWQYFLDSTWVALEPPNDAFVIDAGTTRVNVILHNECDEEYSIEIESVDGPNLLPTPIPAHGSATFEVPTTMVDQGLWSFRITSDVLPDPVFKITRSGGTGLHLAAPSDEHAVPPPSLPLRHGHLAVAPA